MKNPTTREEMKVWLKENQALFTDKDKKPELPPGWRFVTIRDKPVPCIGVIGRAFHSTTVNNTEGFFSETKKQWAGFVAYFPEEVNGLIKDFKEEETWTAERIAEEWKSEEAPPGWERVEDTDLRLNGPFVYWSAVEMRFFVCGPRTRDFRLLWQEYAFIPKKANKKTTSEDYKYGGYVPAPKLPDNILPGTRLARVALGKEKDPYICKGSFREGAQRYKELGDKDPRNVSTMNIPTEPVERFDFSGEEFEVTAEEARRVRAKMEKV